MSSRLPYGLRAAHIARRYFPVRSAIGEAQLATARRMVVQDGVCFMAMSTLHGGAFLSAFLLSLGGSLTQIGLLTSIGLFSQAMQLPGIWLVEHMRHRRPIAFLLAAASRLVWIPIALLPFLPVGDRRSAFLLGLLLSSLLGAASGPAWSSLVRSVLPEAGLGRLFARRMVGGVVLSLVLTLGAGVLLDVLEARRPAYQVYGFSFVLLLGAAFGLLGSAAIARTPEPRLGRPGSPSLLRLLALPFRDPNYRRLMGFAGLWNVALNMASPFFVTYMLQLLHLSMLKVTALLTLGQLAHLVVLQAWGRLADRVSNRAVLFACTPLYLVSVLVWTLTTAPGPHPLSLPLLVVAQVLGGVALAGINLASSSIQLKLSPPSLGHVYMTATTVLSALTGAVAPLAAGVLAEVFAARRFALTLRWSEPSQDFSLSAIDLGALDFVFVLSAVVGLVALRQLRRVREAGDESQILVFSDLLAELRLIFRSDWAAPRLDRLAMWPIQTLRSLRRRAL